MTRPDAAPFSRPVPVASLPPEGFDVKVEATPEECAAVARQFGLPAIHALSGRYHLKGSEFRVADAFCAARVGPAPAPANA